MNPKVILLVEDNRDDIELTTIALQDCRVPNEVAVARDGAEALDYLFRRGAFAGRESQKLPAVVLLDLKLPKVSGFEVLEALRGDARTKLLPVVILTTSNADEDRLKGYTLGCSSYVRKPVDFQKFTEAVKDLGLYWLLHNEEPPRTKGAP